MKNYSITYELNNGTSRSKNVYTYNEATALVERLEGIRKATVTSPEGIVAIGKSRRSGVKWYQMAFVALLLSTLSACLVPAPPAVSAPTPTPFDCSARVAEITVDPVYVLIFGQDCLMAEDNCTTRTSPSSTLATFEEDGSYRCADGTIRAIEGSPASMTD